MVNEGVSLVHPVILIGKGTGVRVCASLMIYSHSSVVAIEVFLEISIVD